MDTENKRKKNKRVLIISRNYNNLLCMARSLAGGDYDIEMVRLIQLKYGVMKFLARFNPERACRYVSRYHICQTNWEPQRFVDFLISIHDPERETVIIPCDDLAIPWIDDNYELLSKYYIISDISKTQGEITKLMNKQQQKKLALEFGLPTAASHEIHIVDGKYEMPEGVGFPCFVKPAVLVIGCKDYLGRYDSPETLSAAIDAMATRFKNLDVLVEDFIDIKTEYAILGMAVDGKAYLPDGCLKFVKGAHGSRQGIMVTGEVVTGPEIMAFLSRLKEFIETIGYTGLFDVDALESDKGIYFCELNLRFGGSGYAITRGGVNFPKLYAQHLLSGEVLPEELKLDGIGKTFVSEKVLLEDCTERFISKEEAEREIAAADIHFIMDEDDPEPYRKIRKQFKYTDRAMMALKNFYKKMRR